MNPPPAAATGSADAGAPPAAGPQVTVVLICFDDAARLPEAIASARAQTLADIEIVIVDHGSTDGSVDVARAAAATDERIRVIALGDNEGKPGRPINTGIRAARAPWVTVFASDDVLRPDACEQMLATATRTGAQLVVGSLCRVNMATGETSRWMPTVTQRSRVITHIEQLPDLIRDTTGGGKLYSTAFVRAHDLSFPQDIYYQDQVFTLEYYARAERVAVLSRYVLDWRHWPDPASGPGQARSITQRRSSVENLNDRFTANERIDAYLADSRRPDLLALKQRKFLQHDLSIHVRDLSAVTAEYRRVLLERTRGYVADFVPEAFAGLPLNKRLMLNCLLAGRLDEAEEVAGIPYNRIAATWPRLTAGERDFLVPPWAADPRAADPCYDVTDYRLPQVPDRFRAARAELLVTGDRRRLHLAVLLETTSGLTSAPAADVVLLDPLTGHRLAVAVRAQAPGRWAGAVRARELDWCFGDEPVELPVRLVFDRGAATSTVISLHPPAEAASLPGNAWQPGIGPDGMALLRRTATPRRRQSPAAGEPALTVREARQYLQQHRVRPRRNQVFFESFAGRRIGDGPLQLSQRLHQRRPRIRQSWSASGPAAIDVPDHAESVARFSVPYLDALARASVWFDNGWLPFQPGPGQRLVQLWHGTPIARLDPLSRAGSWHAVVSSGPHFERQLAAAAGVPVRFLATGAPRTDPLLAPDAAARRRWLRRSWGLDERTVVLYAPMGRHQDVSAAYRPPRLHRLAEQLGATFFWLHRDFDEPLGRSSGTVPEDLRWFAGPSWARLDVADQLLAADILVSDYAGVITDFAITGRPVIHYVPDQQYVEQVFPTTSVALAELAAGPLVRDDAELVAALRAAATIPPGTAFAQALAPLDGRVSADAVLDQLGL